MKGRRALCVVLWVFVCGCACDTALAHPVAETHLVLLSLWLCERCAGSLLCNSCWLCCMSILMLQQGSHPCWILVVHAWSCTHGYASLLH